MLSARGGGIENGEDDLGSGIGGGSGGFELDLQGRDGVR